MNDRVVDRAAPYTTPGRLLVRDGLLVALSFSAGMYEAIGFLSFGKVFTAFQTGNIVFLGLGVFGTRPPAGPDPVSAIISLAAFAGGAALAMPLLRASGAEADLTNAVCVWPRRVSLTLGAGLVIQVGFLAVWMATSRSTDSVYILIALNALAMGMQMNAARSLHVPGVATTAATATFISLASGISTWSLGARTMLRLSGVLVGMGAGGYLGDWMIHHAHAYAPVVPAVVIMLVITTSSMALDPQQHIMPPAWHMVTPRHHGLQG
jgi:uncharacterized membrane protein YoaK (UPF0700 family)